MTRIDYSDGCDRHCFRSDHVWARLVNDAREHAHAKHGAKSIEAQIDHHRFLAILVEEIGEIARVLNERDLGNLTPTTAGRKLADELVDTLAVGSAWLDMLRKTGTPYPPRRPIRRPKPVGVDGFPEDLP